MNVFNAETKELRNAKLLSIVLSLPMFAALWYSNELPNWGGDATWRGISIWATWGLGSVATFIAVYVMYIRDLVRVNGDADSRESYPAGIYIMDRRHCTAELRLVNLCTVLYAALFVTDVVLGRVFGLTDIALGLYCVILSVCGCMIFAERKDMPAINYDFAKFAAVACAVTVIARFYI